MELYQSVILGVIQGLTEFLPISSSGHLVIFQNLFGLKDPEIFFDVCVHLGTLVAVMIYFRKDILSILSTLVKRSPDMIKKNAFPSDDPDIKLTLLIIAGVIPTAIAGLLLDKIAHVLFSSLIITGSMLLVTGIILWLTRYAIPKNGTIHSFSYKTAVLIGIVQGAAIIPGISRSGSTIAAGMFLGLDRELAARYSFLMSIPAIAGAALLSLKGIDSLAGVSTGIILAGVAAAFVVGYLALSLLVYIVKKGQMYMFAPYCGIAGCVALVLGITGN